MPGDRDEAANSKREQGQLAQEARQIGGGPRVVMPSDVLRGEDGPTVPVRDPNTAPIPVPRRAGVPEVPPNVPVEPAEDPAVTLVSRLPRNPVTGQPADGALDVVPIGEPPPTVRVPDPDDATQIRIDADVTVIHPPGKHPLRPSADEATDVKGTPAPASKVDADGAGKPKLATADDLGGGAGDLQSEPLLKWIAIGIGLMLFVSIAFALVAVLVIAFANT